MTGQRGERCCRIILSRGFKEICNCCVVNSGNILENIYQDFGAFEYDEEGFTIRYEDFIKKINWADITRLNVYKVDLMTTDRVDMEIFYADKVFTISEELPGWYQFVFKTKEIFPAIPKDWDITIIQPALETNYRTILRR